MPLLLKLDPDAPPVRFIEVAAHPVDTASQAYIGPERRVAGSAQRAAGSA
jgi:hypothetical protein